MTQEEQKIMSGILFWPGDKELCEIKLRAHNLNIDYNQTYENETEKRNNIIHQLLGEVGEGVFFQGPITFHYGIHTKVGNGCFFNFNTTIQDDGEVTIGERCCFGPNLTIVTPLHPMLASERKGIMCADGIKRGLCYAKPVHIGSDCWFGANVVVCPGVTIGDNCVIGAGSVVTKDVPSNSFAAGNPCRVIREITEKDSMIYKPEILDDNTIVSED